MRYPVLVPSAGESVTEVFIGHWSKKTGDFVKKDEVLVDLETQKTNFELQAEQSGRIEILFPEPETKVKPGDVIAYIDDSATEGAAAGPTTAAVTPPQAEKKPGPAPAEGPVLSPAVRKIAAEKGLDTTTLQGSGKGGRVLKEDVLDRERPAGVPLRPSVPEISRPAPTTPALSYTVDAKRGERAVPATRIRRTIAENLVKAQHTAAILTTFNEVDMTQVIDFRSKHKESFKKKHGVSLSLMSFFARASVRALKEFPLVNATFTGDQIIHRDFVDLSVAVSTDVGLVAPVIRDVDKMSLEDFEKKLADLTERARNRKLSVEEMTGGTFTISNGGVFGSLLSTPILNMPQSAILGLHKIQERPIVEKGEIVIRPMMYLALSYDHRIVDGREAVSFLVKIKEGIEEIYHIIREEDL
jgi:2-oxoglutarate dehydrogenase E2 component (dihydrolipoamide succinyltransferase)